MNYSDSGFLKKAFYRSRFFAKSPLKHWYLFRLADTQLIRILAGDYKINLTCITEFV